MREKYVKGYFALSRLLVSDLRYQRFILKFNKKVRSPGVPDFGVLSPEAWVLSPRSRSKDLGSGSWVSHPGSRVLNPGSWVPSPGSWILILDYAVWSIAVKEEAKNMLCFDEKKTHERWETLLRWVLQNIIENQTFQRIAKFIIWSISMKWTLWKVLVVKVDKMYNILKSANHCFLVERWRWNWMIKVLARVCHWMSIRLLRPSFIKG